ncbi:uncharacterized protein LDX57_008630 [Aspergillus melleus]|uniref:uncharacterized protein n=1 Tax=Aspergillus melleus TaxID=138277 RepID=UPI001E8E574A|nr:uncharacterized protein LDX57_008630 [Aspergillus melleus]KAH8430968.1 hypothetical protein LDX57_008630 [Aspergillus melleus]
MPRIFYGLIASGDRVIKSGIKRTAIIEEINDDVLCFEMEAAGLMNEFPAVVIRGISDYADSHKNDTWQPYAAASAAACAKELLSHLESEKIHLERISARASPESSETLHQFLADICETDPQNEMTRIRQSKGGFVAECNNWIMESPELQKWQTSADARLLWIKGGPGKGKTMAMIGLVDFYLPQIADLCYFFCQNGIPHLNNAVSVLRALVWRLLWTHHGLQKYIPNEYKCKKYNGKEVFESPNAFAMLTVMLSQMLRDETLDKVFVVLDALDECDNGMGDLCEWILLQSADSLSKAKWLISSRQIPQIEELLRPGNYKICLDLDSSEARVLKSVNHLVETRIDQLAERKGLSKKEREELGSILKEKSESTFLWVALVCQRLQLTSRRKLKMELEKLPSGLGPLYDRMLEQLETIDDEDDKELCKRILRVGILSLRPLNLGELGMVVGLPVDAIGDVPELVDLCSSYLLVRSGYVYVIHQSAKDYFCNGRGQRLFADGLADEHNKLSQRLLDVMETQLARNIYGLDHPGILVEEIIRPQSDPLAKSPSSNQRMIDMIQDAYQFVVYNKTCIETAPLQVYCSALIFSPQRSIIKEIFHHEMPQWLVNHQMLDEEWSPCLHILEGHTEPVLAAVFTPDNRFVVSGSDDCSIRIWDTESGTNVRCLKGHTGSVMNLAVSPDGRWIGSASVDCTVRLWNLHTGTLEMVSNTDHYKSILTFSMDSNSIIFLSACNAIQIWDLHAKVRRHAYQLHSSLVGPTALSPHGKWVASVDSSGIIRVGDIYTGKMHKMFRPEGLVSSIVFLSNNSEIASISRGEGVVQVWDIRTGSMLCSYQGNTGTIMSTICLSDGRRVAISAYETVKIRDMKDDDVLQSFSGHDGFIQTVDLSSDGRRVVSGSDDNTLRIWNVDSTRFRPTASRPIGDIELLVLSPDSRVVASAWSDSQVRLWSTQTGSLLHAFGDIDVDPKVAFSSNSKYLATLDADDYIRIWDCASGFAMYTVHSGAESLDHDLYINDIPLFNKHTRSFLTTRQDASQVEWTMESDSQWLKHLGKKVLWVPTIHLPIHTATSHSLFVIGSYTGRCFIFDMAGESSIMSDEDHKQVKFS